MTDYQKYINALRECAKEHEGDKTFTGQIIVSNLCRDVADLLEALEQEPCEDAISRQVVKEQMIKYGFHAHDMTITEFVEDLLPPVNPQEPKILNTLDFAIDASNGDTNYFVGFRNGLRYAKSLIDGKDPQYESCTEQEPNKGHWIPKIIRCNESFICSECSAECSYVTTNYCPSCGARMKGVTKNDNR